jgi:hypothetical protein
MTAVAAIHARTSTGQGRGNWGAETVPAPFYRRSNHHGAMQPITTQKNVKAAATSMDVVTAR